MQDIQRYNPHPQLATARQAVETACDFIRTEAAAVCDVMTTSQVESILAVNGDSKKILNLVNATVRKARELDAEFTTETGD